MSDFKKNVTSDGWTYGKGYYEKKISEYLAGNEPGYSSLVNVPSVIAGALTGGISTMVQVAGTKVTKVAYSKVSHITTPVYYIYTISPSGVKTVAEWPMAEATRNAVYAAWVPNFVGSPSSSKQAQINILKNKPPVRSISAVMSAVKDEATAQGDVYFDAKRGQIERDVKAAAAGTILVLLAAAAVGLFIVLK